MLVDDRTIVRIQQKLLLTHWRHKALVQNFHVCRQPGLTRRFRQSTAKMWTLGIRFEPSTRI